MPEVSDDEQAFLEQLDLWDAEEESEDEPEHAEEPY
jgi:hypothetical protein